MGSIPIRPGVIGDVDAIERYHDLCFRTTYSAQLLAGEFAAPDRQGMRAQLRSWFDRGSEFETWVADVDGVAIGHVTVLRHHLVHLFVEPDRHGTGLGRRLLAHGEELLARAGHDEFELHTRIENLAAIGFYEVHGWTMTDQLIRTVEHGIEYTEHVLVKQRT